MSEPIDGGAFPVLRRAGIDCGEAVELIPAFALGAIEPAERLLVQAHCDHCFDCSTELQESSYAASFLSYSIPLVDPPARAKLALFERIAPVAATPPVQSIDIFESPLVSSPGDKRRRKSTERSETVEERFSPTLIASPFNRLTGRVSKLAMAPLALALVLVSVYAMQTRNDVQDLQTMNAALISSNSNAVAASATEVNAPAVEATIETDTASDMIAQPVLYTFSTAGNGSQTESTRSISPIDSTCKMAGDGAGKYHLQISGVQLPAGTNRAAVYLQYPEGKRTYLTSVAIDASGSGEATFNFNAAIPENSTLLIGPPSSGSAGAQPVDGAVTFLLTSNDSGVVGLGASS